jgi:hypothetical protein
MADALSTRGRTRRPAAPLALAAVALAGCGASAPRHLSASQERQLLALVGVARAQAAAHDPAGVRAALAQLIARVRRLQAAGALGFARAGELIAEARAAAQLAGAVAARTTVRTAATRSTPTATGHSTPTATPASGPPATPSAPGSPAPPGHRGPPPHHGPPPGHGGGGGPHAAGSPAGGAHGHGQDGQASGGDD